MRPNLSSTPQPIGPSGIAALRKIVQSSSAGPVQGQRIDLYSASTMLRVYDELNAENRRRFESLPVLKAHRISFQAVRGAR